MCFASLWCCHEVVACSDSCLRTAGWDGAACNSTRGNIWIMSGLMVYLTNWTNWLIVWFLIPECRFSVWLSFDDRFLWMLNTIFRQEIYIYGMQSKISCSLWVIRDMYCIYNWIDSVSNQYITNVDICMCRNQQQVSVSLHVLILQLLPDCAALRGILLWGRWGCWIWTLAHWGLLKSWGWFSRLNGLPCTPTLPRDSPGPAPLL